ncbi:MAG: SusC/RagA family TonB-linked outer membrane protein [Bacteroidota bacterium]
MNSFNQLRLLTVRSVGRVAFTVLFGLLLSSSLWAQKTVTGTVTNLDDGSPLGGVTVTLQGTTEGAFTNDQGQYSVNVPGDDAVLIFSFLGYTSIEETVGARTTIDISLAEEAISADEVVITALGIERSKKTISYATQSIDTEPLSEARELNVVNSLSGKVAGVSISRSGSGVGSPSRVILRGNRSIAGDSQPLYIVDGVPIIGDITDINPDDIEDISVLKGPNAAALYGNRANNGAIIITTKQGKEGFNLSISQTLTAEVPNILFDYQNQYGQGNTGEYSPASEQSWGPQLNGQQVAHWSPDPNFGTSTYAFEAQPDNVSDFYQTGLSSATNLTISTGNTRNSTLFSYTLTDAEGTVSGNELKRHNANIRVRNELASKLTLDAKLTYIHEDLDNVLDQGEGFANSNRHAYRLPRNIRTEDVSIFEYTTPTGRNRQHFWNPGSNGGANPYWTINRNTNTGNTDRILALASLRYSITDELSIQVRTALDRLTRNREDRDWNDSYIIADNGRFSVSSSEAYEWNNDLLISYDTDLSDDIHLNLNVGGNLREERNSSIGANTGDILTVPNFFAIGNTQDNRASHSFGAPRDVQSVYAFGQVSFLNDAINIEATARNDWSSTLPRDNWSFFYPSFGASVILSDLISLPDNTFLKLRGSWAEVGNDTDPFQLQRTANVGAGGNNGFLTISGTIPNENLLPEETQSIEFGLEAILLDGLVGVDLTYYQTNSRNQLFSVSLPVGSGASEFFTNGGDVQNSGFEAVLRVNPIRSNDFNWNIVFNFAANESEVLEINDERPRIQVSSDFLRAYFIEEGEEYGNVYSRGFQRDDQGRVLIGENGLPLITPGRTVLVANYNPDWLGGLRNSFRWKDLSASFLIDIRQGGSVTSITKAILYGDGLTGSTLPGREGGLIFGENFFPGETAVREDGSPNNVSFDSESFWRLVGGRNAPAGEAFISDASNIRLREFTLGYRLRLANSPLESIKISFVGRNLFFFNNEAGDIDPEVITGTANSAEGFESFGPPTARTLGANIRLDF